MLCLCMLRLMDVFFQVPWVLSLSLLGMWCAGGIVENTTNNIQFKTQKQNQKEKVFNRLSPFLHATHLEHVQKGYGTPSEFCIASKGI